MSHRSEKLAESVKKEMSALLNQNVRDPRLKMITVTSAEVSGDLRYVKVYVSVLGSEDEEKQALIALDKAKGFFRSELSKKIRLRYMPELLFKIDHSIQSGSRIMELLREVGAGEVRSEENE